MAPTNVYEQLLVAATPLFAARGLHGTRVRDIARASGINPSMISYHFGGKEGLYRAVLARQFAGFARFAAIAESEAETAERFAAYLYECGVCFHCGSAADFSPKTASADPDAPECPRCLTNNPSLFSVLKEAVREE